MLRERRKFQYNLFTPCIRLKLTYQAYQWPGRKTTSDTLNHFTHAFQRFFYIPIEREKVQSVQYLRITVVITSYQRLIVIFVCWTHCSEWSYGNYAQVKMHKARVCYDYHYLLEFMLHFRVLYMIMWCMIEVRKQGYYIYLYIRDGLYT